MEQIMRHGKWFNGSGEQQPFWWVNQSISNDWTLNFGDIISSHSGETNTETLPGNAILYLENTISFSTSTVYYRKNGGTSVLWDNNTTVSFTAGDTLSIPIQTGNGATGNIQLKLNNSNGRVIADFDYIIAGGPI
jgi:hypothetical protein